MNSVYLSIDESNLAIFPHNFQRISYDYQAIVNSAQRQLFEIELFSNFSAFKRKIFLNLLSLLMKILESMLESKN